MSLRLVESAAYKSRDNETDDEATINQVLAPKRVAGRQAMQKVTAARGK